MTPLADLIRETLTERSEAAPQDAALLESVRHGIKRARLRRALGASTTTLALVGMMVAAGISISSHSDRPSQVALGSGDVPPGMQAVSFRGVELLVPADWPLDATKCGTPIDNTVLSAMPGQVTPLCLYPQPPGLTVVRLQRGDSYPAKEAERLANQPVDLDGHEAFRGTGVLTDYQGPVTVLVVPSQNVVAVIESSKPELAQRILDSARIVTTDAVGCPTRRSTSSVVQYSAADGKLVPGQPQAAAVCRYGDGWLVRSASLSPTEASTLAAQLNALPKKTSFSVRSCPRAIQSSYMVRFDIGADRALNIELQNNCFELTAARSGLIRQADLQTFERLMTYTGNDSFSLGETG